MGHSIAFPGENEMIAILLATLMPCFLEEVPLENPTAFFEALYKPIEDVTCDFEGRSESRLWDHPEHQVLKESETYSGLFIYRNDNDLKHEVTIHTLPLPNQQGAEKYSIHKKLALIDNKTFIYVGDAINGGWMSNNSTFGNLFFPGSAFNFFWVPYLKLLSGYDQTKVYYQDDVMVGELRCKKISFTFGQDFDKFPITDETSIESFYLDMSRGGHPVLVETRRKNGEISWRVVDIELQQFTDKNQRMCWLPVSGRFETLMVKQMKSELPNIRIGNIIHQESSRILPGSVKLNTHPKNSDFILRFKNGKVIPDMKNVKPDTTRLKSKPNPEKIEAEKAKLEQLIKEGEEQGTEILAPSEERGGTRTTADWMTYILSAFGVVGLGVAIYLVKTGRA